jgi:DNA primase
MSDTQRIKDALSISDLVGEYVELKTAGVNQKGLCPFHQEKSPSFMVSAERQRWHCFGCNKGGDIFTFVQEIEGMDFPEALRMLANKAGIELTQTFSQGESSLKGRIKDINSMSAQFYHHILTQMDGGKDARTYLENRKLEEKTILDWQVGFVPEQWDLLTKFLLKKGFGIDDLVASGLTIKREGADSRSGRGFYDRFRGRVMFPIQDIHGGVVGFTGRVLVETEKSGGKYVNTPQTAAYDKSRVIFGLDKAKKEIRQKDYAILVEGQMDVIASHQAGVTNVVATSGTALTEHQIKLLKRYTSNIRVAFDADAAGQKAAKRGIDLALAAGMHVRVITIPEGKDPDDAIKQSKQIWLDAIEEAKDIMQWYVDKAFEGKNLSNPRDKQEVADEVLPEIARVPFAVEQDHWLHEVAGRLHVETKILRQDMKRFSGGEKKGVTPQAKEEPQILPEEKKKKTRIDQLVERLYSLILSKPDKVPDGWWVGIEKPLSTSVHLPLYEVIKRMYSEGSSVSAELVGSTADLSPLVNKLVIQGDTLFSSIQDNDVAGEYKQLLQHIHDLWLKEERHRLQQDIASAEREGNQDLVKSLLEQFQSLH